MKEHQIKTALRQLAPYGFSLTEDNRFRRATGVKIVDDGEKLRALSIKGLAVLWTGDTFEAFVRWYGNGPSGYIRDVQSGEVHKVMNTALACEMEGKFVAQSADGTVRLWTGNNVGHFVSKFWGAVRIDH
jgi:hypothetical protein